MGGGGLALQQLLLTHPQFSLSSTQGLTLWAAVQASWVLRFDVVFRGVRHTLPEFVQHWRGLCSSGCVLKKRPCITKRAPIFTVTCSLACKDRQCSHWACRCNWGSSAAQVASCAG